MRQRIESRAARQPLVVARRSRLRPPPPHPQRGPPGRRRPSAARPRRRVVEHRIRPRPSAVATHLGRRAERRSFGTAGQVPSRRDRRRWRRAPLRVVPGYFAQRGAGASRARADRRRIDLRRPGGIPGFINEVSDAALDILRQPVAYRPRGGRHAARRPDRHRARHRRTTRGHRQGPLPAVGGKRSADRRLDVHRVELDDGQAVGQESRRHHQRLVRRRRGGRRRAVPPRARTPASRSSACRFR